jgi:hypothetical protein
MWHSAGASSVLRRDTFGAVVFSVAFAFTVEVFDVLVLLVAIVSPPRVTPPATQHLWMRASIGASS